MARKSYGKLPSKSEVKIKSAKSAPARSASKALKKNTASSAPARNRLPPDALKDIWPAERDIFFRPDRLKYVRKLIKEKGCVFCAAAGKGVGFESLCLYRDDVAMVVMNKFPYNNGHLLIIPARHEGEFTELKKDELYRLQDLLKRAMKALLKEYGPGGFNVGLNLGAVAGAGIPDHLHYHLVPRWRGDTNFFPLLAETKVIVETLEQTYKRLLPYFE